MCHVRQAIVVNGAGLGSYSTQSATQPLPVGRTVQQVAAGSHKYASAVSRVRRSFTGCHALSSGKFLKSRLRELYGEMLINQESD